MGSRIKMPRSTPNVAAMPRGGPPAALTVTQADPPNGGSHRGKHGGDGFGPGRGGGGRH